MHDPAPDFGTVWKGYARMRSRCMSPRLRYPSRKPSNVPTRSNWSSPGHWKRLQAWKNSNPPVVAVDVSGGADLDIEN